MTAPGTMSSRLARYVLCVAAAAIALWLPSTEASAGARRDQRRRERQERREERRREGDDPTAHVIPVTLINISANGGVAPKALSDRLVEIYARNGIPIRVTSAAAKDLDTAEKMPAGPLRLHLTDGTVPGNYVACEGTTYRNRNTKRGAQDGYYRAKDSQGTTQYLGTVSRVRLCTSNPITGAQLDAEKVNLLTAWALAHELLHGILTITEALNKEFKISGFPLPTYSEPAAEGHLNTVSNLVMAAPVATKGGQMAKLVRDVRGGALDPLETIVSSHLTIVRKLVEFRTE